MSEIKDFNFCKETAILKGTIESAFLSLGERLRRIRMERLYQGQWSSFEEYCLDMKMPESTASKLISIYEKFIVNFGIEPELLLAAGGWSSVAEIVPVVHSKEEALYWIDKATVLSRPDLRIEVRIARTGIPPEKCSHLNSYTLKICRDCGNKEQIHDDTE